MRGQKMGNLFNPTSIIVILILITLTTITGIISYAEAYNNSIDSITQEQRAVANRLEGWLSVMANRAEHNALLLRELEMDISTVIHYFSLQAEAIDDLSIAFAGFPDGSLIFGGNWEVATDLNITIRPWYVAAMQAPGQIVFSRPYMGAATGELAFAATRTVGNDDDSLGIVALSLPFNRMQRFIMQEMGFSDQHSVMIIDSNGGILLHPDPTLAPISDIAFHKIDQVHGGKYVGMFESIQSNGFYSSGQELFIGLPIEFVDWYIIISVPTSYIINNIVPTIISLVATATFSLVVLIGAWIMIRRINLSSRREIEAIKINKTIIDTAPFIINTWDSSINLISTNDHAKKMFELPSKKEYIQNFFSLSPEYQPDGILSTVKATELISKALHTSEPLRFEWMHQALDGKPMPTEVILKRLVRDGKYIIAAYTVDMRQTQAAIDANNRATLMMSASPISCFMIEQVLDKDGQIEFEVVDLNQAAIKLFGFSSKAEAFGRFYEIFSAPSAYLRTADEIFAHVQDAMENDYTQFSYTHRSLDGESVPCSVTLARVDYQGKPTFICFQTDLRPFITVMEKEKYAHDTTKMFLNAAPFFIEIWNEDLQIIECNILAAYTFGLSSCEEYIERFFEFCPEYQPCGTLSTVKIGTVLKECFENGHARTEWMHVTSDGEPFPVDVTYIRLKQGSSYIATGYCQDLRELKMSIEQTQAAEEENQAKTQFLAHMSHEIRTPLNSILGVAEIELQKNTHASGTEEAFQRIHSSSRLLQSIINDILDLSKVAAGRMEIIPAMYETASFIADTVQLNVMAIGSKRIEFSVEADDKLPAYLIGDEIRIKQVLNNILSNAFKYTHEGKVSLKFGVEAFSEPDYIMLVVSVSDTGQGMTPEQLDQFGEEFRRFNLEKNRSIEGSGLGAAISNALIHMMGGRISVESEYGKGSVFTVSIPQKIENNQILDKEILESLHNFTINKSYMKRFALQAHEPMPYGRVLVVDDVESNLYVVQGYLSPYKIHVETVTSGADAIALVEGGQVYDIIFMDHMMPEMDGIEATKILHSIGYDQPIVALTANATFGISQLFLNNGFSDFISKPIDPKKLDSCLMKHIYEKQPPEVIAAAQAKYFSIQPATDDNLLPEIRKAFLSDADKSIAVLEPLLQMEEMDDGAFRLYTIQTHAVKSALTNINKPVLSAAAEMLEMAGNNKDIDVIKHKTPAFLEDLRAVVQSLSRRRKDSSLSIVENNALVSEKMLAVYVACTSFDISAAQEVLDQIIQLPISNRTAYLINEIESFLMHGNYIEAAALAKQFCDSE